MRRNWPLWTIFTIALLTALAAMGWISFTVARMETHSRHRDQVEENVRLALWRMDSTLAPLVAQETARPYFAYSAFTPAERAYTRMFNEITFGEVLVPSPLLAQDTPFVLLHFQIDPDGNVTSPQVPRGNMRDLARQHYVSRERVADAEKALAELHKSLPKAASFACAAPTDTPEPATITLPNVNNDFGNNALNNAGSSGDNNRQQQGQQQVNTPIAQQKEDQQQQLRSQTEYQARSIRAQVPNYAPNRGNTLKAPPSHVREGVMAAQWIGPDTLVLARRVSVNRDEYVQGVWLDWPAIRQYLLSGVTDLLPDARLEPVATADAPPEKQGRRLAAIPVKLEPGRVAPIATAGLSPIQGALYTAWAGVILGSLAVALLLWGTLRLSERRAAFVSAVTHELRTPLTTVSMYAEMLEQGMVQPDRKQEYLSTLRAEASRLGHLVENVLAYSRIERGSASSRIQTLPIPQLIDGVRQRLEERSQQAGLAFAISLDPDAEHASVQADASAVEQILFNLVDNAAKYAISSPDKRLDLTATVDGAHALLRIRDHGPGIGGQQLKRLFQPFSKSAQDAAHSAPGVGLGLALSRRLAREMRGELSLEKGCEGGACFLLRLPLAEVRQADAAVASVR